KTPPAYDLLKKAAGVEKGSAQPNRDKVGTVTAAQVREIAETKLADLNAFDIGQAMHTIEGTARSMGLTVEPEPARTTGRTAMPHQFGKNYRMAAEKVEAGRLYPPREAVELVRATSMTKFDPTIEAHLRLGIDPRHADQ